MHTEPNTILSEVLEGIVAHLRVRIPIVSMALYPTGGTAPLARVGSLPACQQTIEIAPGLVAEAIVPSICRCGEESVRSFPIADGNGRKLGICEITTQTGLSEPQSELLAGMAQRLSVTLLEHGQGA
jgi:hypothetical protein